MKINPELKAWLLWFLFLGVLFMMHSCAGSKTIDRKQSTTKQTQTSEIKKDSTSNTVTNGAINDRIIINVPESKDPASEKLINAILKQLNTSKSSGSNSYRSVYDEELRQLIFDFKIAQTKNQDTSTNSEENTKKTFEQQTDAYFSKKIKIIPWWGYALAAYFLRSHIFGVFGFFFPQIRTIKSFSDLTRSKNANTP